MKDDSPLPDTMYCRECAIRLLRHAAWYVMALRLPIAAECVNILGYCQKQVLGMNTGDFYRIKIMGAMEYKLLACPCVCHQTLGHEHCCETCAGLHARSQGNA